MLTCGSVSIWKFRQVLSLVNLETRYQCYIAYHLSSQLTSICIIPFSPGVMEIDFAQKFKISIFPFWPGIAKYIHEGIEKLHFFLDDKLTII